MIANKYLIVAVVASILLSVAMAAEEPEQKNLVQRVAGEIKKGMATIMSHIPGIGKSGNKAASKDEDKSEKKDGEESKDDKPAEGESKADEPAKEEEAKSD